MKQQLSQQLRIAFLLVAATSLPSLALAQGSPMVPTSPGTFGVDTVSTFFAGDPAVVPGASSSLGAALANAFGASMPQPASQSGDAPAALVAAEPTPPPASSDVQSAGQ